jgi:hypothetical protein
MRTRHKESVTVRFTGSDLCSATDLAREISYLRRLAISFKKNDGPMKVRPGQREYGRLGFCLRAQASTSRESWIDGGVTDEESLGRRRRWFG